MDFIEFKEKIAADVRKERPFLETDFIDVTKLQGLSYEGMSVKYTGSAVGATLNMDRAFAQYERTGDYDMTFMELLAGIDEAMKHMPKVSAKELEDYEYVKENLTIQLIPTDMNRDVLQNIPHREIEDMSIVYRIQLDVNKDGSATSLITNKQLAVYGISADQLHNDAMENAAKLMPPVIRSMLDVMKELMGGMDLPEPDGPQMFVASTPCAVNGAGVIAYPGFMETAREQLGSDFYVLPSSLHEVILLRDTGEMNAAELSNMVRSINETEVAPEDRLSNQAFHYDSEARIFETAEHYEQRKNGMERSERMRDDPEKEDLTVLLVHPGSFPEVVTIGSDLSDLQAAVGGMIEVTYPFDDNVALIMNEEGKTDGLPLNRALRDEAGEILDIIAGDFLVAGLTEDSFRSLTPDEIKQYEPVFHQPEAFVKMGKSIRAVPIPDEIVDTAKKPEQHNHNGHKKRNAPERNGR